MIQSLDFKMILKAGAGALVLMLIIGIFDLYDLGGRSYISDLFREPEGFRGRPGNDGNKIISYIFSWIAITLIVSAFLYFSSEKKKRKKLSQNT